MVVLAGLLAGGYGCRPTDRSDPEAAASITIYSGRSERLIGPILDRFAEQTGIQVNVRYAGSSELLATLLEEGANSPADLFISQDAAALGALSREGALVPLPESLLERVPAAYRSHLGNWVGLSGRARVVVYNTERIAPEHLPRRLEDVTAERYRGKFGVAPTNASFQAHMAMYAAVNGRDALQKLLGGITANRPLRYPKNSPIVEAVIAGEIDWGLVNHYYLWRALKENPAAPVRNHFMAETDGSAFINVAGAGLLRDSGPALELLRFLLAADAQRYFAAETYEYPLIASVPVPEGLPPLDELQTTEVDYRQVANELEAALTSIQQSGLMQFQ